MASWRARNVKRSCQCMTIKGSGSGGIWTPCQIFRRFCTPGTAVHHWIYGAVALAQVLPDPVVRFATPPEGRYTVSIEGFVLRRRRTTRSCKK